MNDYDNNGDNVDDSSEGDNVYRDLSSLHNYYKTRYAHQKDYKYLEQVFLQLHVILHLCF
jgi:hypothetical protein